MYLHIGQDVILRTEDIIGIFDMDTATASKHTRALIGRMEQTGNVISVFDDLPKSFIVCGGETPKVYISQISTGTLLKRAENSLAALTEK